jgi:diguanylate cyclase (GGDEF)-like protein
LASVRIRTAEANLFWPLVLVAFIAMAAAGASGLGLVASFDHAAAEREQMVVDNGLRGRMSEVAHLSISEVVWDDAVRYLDNGFDLAWAQQNIGTYFWQNDHFEYSFILRPDNTPIFAALAGEDTPVSRYAPFAADTAKLLATLRAAEARRGPMVVRTTKSTDMTPPILSSTLANIAGKIYILSATLVEPDFGTAAPAGPRAPIVVTAMRIDDSFIQALAQRFLLTRLRLLTGSAAGDPAAAHIYLRNSAGAPVAMLEWAPERPGRALLQRIGVPMLTVMLALSSGILLLSRRAKRIADQLVTSEARATHMAYYDSLTGLPNRVLFADRLSHALNRMRRTNEVLAVYCLDLDRFKLVNDTFGHHAGDALIKAVGRIMQAQFRASDTVARMSGDEFAIIQSEASVSAAAALAGRLTEMLRAPIELEDVGTVFIGCSVGITIVSDPSLQPAEILRQADMALYRTKETSKGNYCFFEEEMDSAIKTRRALEADLRSALTNGSLHMAYQPQINERTGITGVEALLRWRHPVKGDLSPAFFISIAEECGLIIDLGMFALRRAFEDSKRWKHLKVGINISPKQLRMKDFAQRVLALAKDVGVEPSQFELEITEGYLLADDPETLLVLNRLRDEGFELALDDFGTGYSSLSYLQRYPINRIKIDRSFIANLGVADEADEFITAIVRLARALKLSVIAEGVETTSQHSRLSEAGCSDMQGYLFGKPVSADDIDKLAAAPRKNLLAA